MKHVATVLCARDVIQPKSSLGGASSSPLGKEQIASHHGPRRRQQERPAYHHNMNNFRFPGTGEHVAAVLCARDVIQQKSSLGDP